MYSLNKKNFFFPNSKKSLSKLLVPIKLNKLYNSKQE